VSHLFVLGAEAALEALLGLDFGGEALDDF
jgi:hypothetical protein